MFLLLPSDKEVLRYLAEFGKELNIISGQECLVMALSRSEIKEVGFDEDSWSTTILEHTNEGYSEKVARLFDIKLDQFPCMVVFQDIRTPDHIRIPLGDMTAEEIGKRMRTIFDTIREAVSKGDKPLAALAGHLKKEGWLGKGRAIFSFAGKTFEKAIEISMKAYIESTIK